MNQTARDSSKNAERFFVTLQGRNVPGDEYCAEPDLDA